MKLTAKEVMAELGIDGMPVLTREERQALRTKKRASNKAEMEVLASVRARLSNDKRNELKRKRREMIAKREEQIRLAAEARKAALPAKQQAKKAEKIEKLLLRAAKEKQERMWRHQELMSRRKPSKEESSDLGVVDSL